MRIDGLFLFELRFLLDLQVGELLEQVTLVLGQLVVLIGFELQLGLNVGDFFLKSILLHFEQHELFAQILLGIVGGGLDVLVLVHRIYSLIWITVV